MTGPIRTFDTGATRDTDAGKLDFEGFLCPLVLERYAEYMDKNRRQKDGTYRDSDNWQKGIPFVAYAKSLWRHFFAFWKRHRGYTANESLEDSLCAVIFNASGYLHEVLKKKDGEAPMVRMADISEAELIEEMKRPSQLIVPLHDVDECSAGSKAWLKNLDWTNSRWVPAYDQHIGAGYPLGRDAE